MKQIIFFFFMLPVFLNAQPFVDAASVYYQYSLPDKAPAEKKERKTHLLYLGLNYATQVDSDFIAFSPAYENLRMHPELPFLVQILHNVYVPVTWLHQWSSKWKTAFIFIPRLATADEHGIRHDAFQLGGAVVNTYARQKNLKYKFGVYYNSEFFGPYFLPLLGIDWNINSRLNLFGLLPGSMNLEYKFSKNFHGGISFRSITNSYRVYPNRFYKIYDNHLKLFADFYIAEKQVVTLEAGHTFLRKYQHGNRTGGRTSYYDVHVTDGSLFKIGYAYRIRRD